MIAKIPSLYHFDSPKSSRVKCDTSHNGLGARLEQEIEPGVWAPTAFGSRFLIMRRQNIVPMNWSCWQLFGPANIFVPICWVLVFKCGLIIKLSFRH